MHQIELVPWQLSLLYSATSTCLRSLTECVHLRGAAKSAALLSGRIFKRAGGCRCVQPQTGGEPTPADKSACNRLGMRQSAVATSDCSSTQLHTWEGEKSLYCYIGYVTQISPAAGKTFVNCIR